MKKHILKFIIVLITLFIILNNFIFAPGNILSWDVFGYYLYLPFKFIYHDLGLHNDTILNSIIAKYHSTVTFYQALKMPDGNYVMKYSMGLSFFYAPFFFIGHFIALNFNYPGDGFSFPYQYSIFIGSIICSIIGIWALSKVLTRFFSDAIVAIVLTLVVFSTNYIVHITMYGQNAMSQNYLFMTYALILWITILWHETYKLKYAILLGILCGITVLSRPSEIVCLLIPALWGIKNTTSLGKKLQQIYAHRKQVIVFAIILLAFGFSQIIYWKIYTHKFLFYSYGGNAGEGFEFLHPYVSEVLFSFRKGWLIYTPIMSFAIIGFYFIYLNNRSIFYTLLAYFVANLYIVSSWSCWWYAQSFSQRALIPSYPVMAIGLGYFLTWLNQQKRYLKISLYLLMIAFVILNVFQTKQFQKGIIDGDRMTKNYYFRAFGKMHATEEDKKLLLIKRGFDGIEDFSNESEYRSRLLNKLDFESSVNRDSSVFYSGKYSFRLDSLTIYSPGIESPYYELTNKDHAWLKVSAFIYPTKDISLDPFSLVIHFDHNGFPYEYKAFDSDKMKLELNKWNKIVFNYLTPEVREKDDFLHVYFWNRGHSAFFIDDFQVEVFVKKY